MSNKLWLYNRRNDGNGTYKYLWQLDDGNIIETVFLQHPDKECVCVSTQVGCSKGCKFCATAQSSFIRNLSSEEIVDQVLCTLKDLGKTRIDRILFNGGGEPLDNYNAVADAIDYFRDNLFKTPQIFLSTCGIVPQIYRLADEKPFVRLWLSLHAPTNTQREVIMPINSIYPIEELLEAGKYYAVKTCKEVHINYMLIKGFNDSFDDAKQLANLLKNKPFILQISRVNSSNNTGFNSPPLHKILEFGKFLEKLGLKVEYFESKGTDIAAGCGQLRSYYSYKATGANIVKGEEWAI
jgi:23S rRNA (adenine2503-C2)-methyltransferase